MTAPLRGPFDCVSPTDARYYGGEPEFYALVHPYLSEGAALRYQMRVEAALAAELEASGVAPQGFGRAVAAAAEEVTPEEVHAEEEKVQHNVRALVNCLRRRLPAESSGLVHLFATSNDVLDTARAAALGDFTREGLLPLARELLELMGRLAERWADLVQMGRTHGRHAEPLTLGYWMACLLARVGERTEVLARAAGNLRGKLSGAVGARNALEIAFPGGARGFEDRALARLGLRAAEEGAGTQVVAPEPVADYGHALVSLLSVLANVADDCRHLMRSEIEELVEPVAAGHGRVGSSTMPHKVNPKDFENVKSLWKAFAPRVLTLYMDQISEHQRDLTNSASLRWLNELAAGTAYALRRLRIALGRVDANERALAAHLEAGTGWSVAEPLYIGLALAGRRDPYETSRALVDRARESGVTLLDLLRGDDALAREVMEGLAPAHRRAILEPVSYVGDAPARARAIAGAWRGRP